MIAKLFLKMIGNTSSINFQQTNWHFLISYTRIIYLFFCVSKFVLSGSFALITKITLVCRAARPLSPLGSRKTNIRRRKEERLPKHHLSSQGKCLSLQANCSAMAVVNRLLRSTATPSSSILSKTFSSITSNTDRRPLSPLSHSSLHLRRDPKDRNVQWVFLGCPGVGKGTYASRLTALLGVPHIATGDLVREELASSGPLASQVN